MRSLAAATTLAVLFSSAALTATPAFADSVKPVSAIEDAADTVVDGTHQRVFISDPSTNQIAVTDGTGAVIGTLTGLPQVRDLTLSPDDGTLYAAVYGADKIVAFDTATLAQTAEYATGTGTIPSRLAYADGKLWFGYGDQWDSDLGVVDLTAETPTVTLGLAVGHDFATPPALYADPDNPGTLLALDTGISSGPIVVYDISSGTPVLKVTEDKGGFYKDAALTPDGQNVVVAGPGTRALTEYRLSDLAEVRTYPVPSNPLTVSVAPDGTVAATVLDTDDVGDTYVFPTDASKPVNVRNLSHDWMPGGHLTNWTADGSKLFLVTDTYYTPQFRVVDEPRKYAATLTVNAPATAPRAKTLTVSGTLTANLALPAGTPVTVTRTDLESPNGKSLGTKSLGTGGKFSFTDVPPAGAKVTYTVTYAGDAEHTGATASDTVDVSRATPTLTLNNNGKVYSYGQDVKFTAHLGTTYKNRTVEIWANPYGADKPNTLVKKGTVNSDGNLSVVVDLKRKTELTAKFAGDSRYAPRSVVSKVGAKVSISTSVSGAYKTKYTWNHTYYFFRQSKDPIVTATLPPYGGRTQLLQVQYWSGTSWVTTYREYFKLDSAGKSAVQLTGTPPKGVRFRVRNSYVSGSGDSVNTTTYGSWKYFTFTS
ncbi:WD40 repeat domain-containing protein [Streptomyces justiciae]|uniref:WD40 repeat domain-containing protein n=1 Tax=Streptomyces justiciae TaxID=2780140 RepID=A0ABU3M601_9ACTN|nr:WD40 repeat domain-containing protein [Streptomyces justiciae]MDT7846935.1 WD40 repeat domain-containing protein [Streptomyces justiciae]